MEKPFAIVALFLSAFCFASVFARDAPADEKFFVEGKIYCDPCGFQFESRLSFPIPGAKVTLQCTREDDRSNVTLVKEGKTDANGAYSIPADGDHEEEHCVVIAETPAEGTCTQSMATKSDRIVLTDNMGVSSLARYVNPLGFMTQALDPQCATVFQELGLDKLDD